MRLREFAPSPERDDNDDIPDQLVVLANRWWNATDRQPQIEHVLNSLGWSIHQVESEDDAVQLQHRDGTTHFISADDFDPDLFEIARIPQGDYGTAGTIDSERVPAVDRKELPGGSGLTYGINQKDTEFLEIMIFDQDEIVGELDLSDTRGPMKTWSVENLAVDPQHRGRGIAKSLYGIALSILRLPVEAGQLQTGYGQKMWLMLNSIPGVEVVGSAMDRTADYRPRAGDDIVYQDENYTHYTFPVRAGKHSMRSSRPGTGIYTRPDTTMVARWTGR